MAVALWVLVTAIEVADPCVATPRRCLLSHYRSLDPRTLAAVKALRDSYVSDAQTSPPGPPSPRARRAPAADPADVAGRGRSKREHRPRLWASAPRAPPAGGLGTTSGQVAACARPSVSRCLQPASAPCESRAVPCTVRTTVRPGAFHVQESPPPQRFGGLARRPSLTPALVPQEEETLSWRPRNCSFRPRRDRPRPWSCARLRVVVRDLADAQAVLSRLPSPDRFPGTGPTLELLAAARRDVGACLELVRPGSWRKSLRPPRRRPPTRRADSPRCHEANVIFNLLRLLTWDLKLVANSGPCL
ncbi:interferon lambda-4-like [Mustela nigripes]|uniref:interferon lambda-4-like n=1 Tax=Mustela nigripes TaxID=77151 RepID=UPI002815B661|nr:interferon lambda-4-like [Mustela nigripes]